MSTLDTAQVQSEDTLEIIASQSQVASPSPSSSNTIVQDRASTRVESDNSSTSDTRSVRGAVLSELIYPTSPTYTKRYKFDRKIEDKPAQYIIPAVRISYEDEELPDGWKKCIHPEGLPYFYQLPSQGCPMRVLTDEWLYDPKTAEHISAFLQEIKQAIVDHNATIYPESDLFLELGQAKDSDLQCGYYFVHHPTKTIYWLEEVSLECQSLNFSGLVRGEITNDQAKICLEVEYWAYWDSFPNLQGVSPEIHKYAVNVIASAMTDVISSKDSTIAWTHEQLNQMLDLIRQTEGCETSNWHIGRFLKLIVQDRMRNYYGAYNARISRSQKVLESPPAKRSKFFWLFSPFLFFIPHAQLERVEPLIVDQGVMQIHWEKYFRELHEEWDQTMMLATIMLAANCAFLAIPLFDVPDSSASNSDIAFHSSSVQIASYFSLLASLFGLILSMIMYRQQRVRCPSSPGEIIAYVFADTEAKPQPRLQHLVLIWSLPHALVTWSVVTFLLAFLLMCFIETLTSTKVLVASTTMFLSSLVFYYVIRFGGGREVYLRWWRRVGRVAAQVKRISIRATGQVKELFKFERSKDSGKEGDAESQISTIV